LTEFKEAPTVRYLIADSKLYNEKNANNLSLVGYITRIPETIQLAKQTIEQALEVEQWQSFDEGRRYQVFEVCHYGIVQRWIVVFSEAAPLATPGNRPGQSVPQKERIRDGG